MIEDGKPNCLSYPRSSLVCGSQVFRNTIKPLFDMKQNKVPEAKVLINLLWGALCKANDMTLRVPLEKERFEIKDGMEIKHLTQENDCYKITLVDNLKPFEFPEARMKPFLLAEARDTLTNWMKSLVDEIIHVHTDGFLVAGSPKLLLERLCVGTNLGDLKYQGFYEEVTVVNVMKVEGELKACRPDLFEPPVLDNSYTRNSHGCIGWDF